MKRFLITTPLQETWKKDGPILFLGEWCLPYPRPTFEQAIDVEVMPYHWDDRQKLLKDYQYLSAYYEVVLKEVSQKLNEIHHEEHDLRYWRILIGPWLGFFMLMLFDRWSSIQQAINNYDLSGSIVLDGMDSSFIPNDMKAFCSFFPSDEWNHYVYSQILKQSTSLKTGHCQREKHFSTEISSSPTNIKAKGKEILGLLLSHAGNLFSNKYDALFLSTYLTKVETAKLCMQLGQFPRLLFQKKTPLKVIPDFTQRRWNLAGESEPGFETCLRVLIPQQLPVVYLEGYKQLVKLSQTLPWPNQPKVIWTSNSYHLDDVFKVWAANKVENGAPLIIGQHGGNYGMGLWNWSEQHEIAISDCYLTWGWSRTSMPKLRPIGMLNHLRPHRRFAKDGFAVLVTVMTQRYGNPNLSMYTSSQWLEYLQEQFDFVDALPSYIQNQLIVRLYEADYGWNQVTRWRDRFPKITINDGSSGINTLLRNSRLYISTYNATTYLESLSMNTPTVIFWDPKYMETNVWAQPYFDELKSVSIFHETPQSAAQHVVQVWDDVAAWWKSPRVRIVRDRFVKQFADCSDDKVLRLKNAIQEVVEQCLQHG